MRNFIYQLVWICSKPIRMCWQITNSNCQLEYTSMSEKGHSNHTYFVETCSDRPKRQKWIVWNFSAFSHVALSQRLSDFHSKTGVQRKPLQRKAQIYTKNLSKNTMSGRLAALEQYQTTPIIITKIIGPKE